MNKLLNRDDFRNSVFERDNHKCIICGDTNISAHHIIDRKLFTDGGYYTDNGASLCDKHHLDAEMTLLSVGDIRKAIGIKNIIIPKHLNINTNYDKWGNEILNNGMRLMGEMFEQENVQRILTRGKVLNNFTEHIKYPRTKHLPHSESVTADDKMLKDYSQFIGKYVVATEKMDGENSSLYPKYYHARSLDSNNHPSRNWLKAFWANMCYNIPEKWRVCGENLYARHSIQYSKENGNPLDSYFYMFSIWDENNMCLSWDETKEWAYLLDLKLVSVLYEGIFDLEKLKAIDITGKEGYVLRLADSFHYSEFSNSVAKYVRKNHVQTSKHWTTEKIIPNDIK